MSALGVVTHKVRLWWLGSLGAGTLLGFVAFSLGLGGDAVLPVETTPTVVRLISSVTGWTYFVCWSVSFWPQVVLNHRRRAVEGLSVDFLVLNVLGFIAYALYNIMLFCPTSIRNAYIDVHETPPAVHCNDVVFSLHALLLTAASLGQAATYAPGRLRVRTATLVFCGLSAIGVLAAGARGPLLLVDVLSAIKIAASLIKYVPQIAENRSRSSTGGFSFSQVVLDATGSVLSISQLLLDAFVLHSWRLFVNPAKLLLGVISLLYDGLLTYQHISYGGHDDIDEPLL